MCSFAQKGLSQQGTKPACNASGEEGQAPPLSSPDPGKSLGEG